MAAAMEGKVALVTGAGGGIGRATAELLAGEGAKVVVADVSVAGGEETVELIRAAGGEASFQACDVSSASDAEALVAKTVELYGRLDCAVNNAGIEGDMAVVHECEESNWDRVMNINVKGVFLCSKYEIAQMLKNGGGSIVNTASIAGLRGGAEMSPYCASKHAVIGFSRSAAIEYAQQGIRVNAICPGSVHTSMVDRIIAECDADPSIDQATRDMLIGIAPTPMQRLCQPMELAQAMLWLCSDASSFVTGSAMTVDGGWTA